VKRLIVLATALTLLVGGVAIAQTGDDAKNLKIDEAIATLEEAKAIPADVVTVTTTETATVTATVTQTVTQTPPPTTTPPLPPPGCTGTAVAPGGGLKAAMDASSAGATFCLSAGTYNVTSEIITVDADRVIGAGQTATFINGSGIDPDTNRGVFVGGGYFEGFDIGNVPTPPAGVTGVCPSDANCGMAFRFGGTTLTLQSITCHDNGGACINGGGSTNIVVDDLDCFNNGNAYSATGAFSFAACIKHASTTLGSTDGDTIITNSYIHDNYLNGVWCDFCRSGFFKIENSVIEDNGGNGVQWEVSGGFSGNGATDDFALITGSTFHGNNWRKNENFRGGVAISTAADITVENSIFGQNLWHGVAIIYTSGRISWPMTEVVVRNNTMNGNDIRGCELSGVTCTNNS
jgi:hypothetical protein